MKLTTKALRLLLLLVHNSQSVDPEYSFSRVASDDRVRDVIEKTRTTSHFTRDAFADDELVVVTRPDPPYSPTKRLIKHAYQTDHYPGL